MPLETWKHKTETINRTNDSLLIKMFVTLTPVFGIEQDRFNLSSLMHCLNLFSSYQENLKRNLIPSHPADMICVRVYLGEVISGPALVVQICRRERERERERQTDRQTV